MDFDEGLAIFVLECAIFQFSTFDIAFEGFDMRFGIREQGLANFVLECAILTFSDFHGL